MRGMAAIWTVFMVLVMVVWVIYLNPKTGEITMQQINRSGLLVCAIGVISLFVAVLIGKLQ